MNSLSASDNYNVPPDQTANFATNLTTPLTTNLSHLEQRALEQRTDLENARALISQNRFPSKAHLDAQVKMTVRWARELNLLERHILAIKRQGAQGPPVLPSPSDTDNNPATPPTTRHDVTHATATPAIAERESPGLSPWLRSLSFEDFAFSSDKDPLDQIKRQAGEPIDFGAEGNDTLGPCLEIPAGLLATLDPATSAETLHLAQELRALDVHLAEGRLQQ